MDMDNLAPAPDIDNFTVDPTARGDFIEAPVVPVTDDKVEDIFEDKAADKAAETAVDEPEDEVVESEKPRDEKGKFTAKGIPKERFDEAVGKEREAREAAERRADEAERKLNATAQAQVQNKQVEELEATIEALETKHAELLLDGDPVAAAKVMKEIRMSERQIARAESEAISTQRTSQALEGQRVETAIARLEADHAALNPNSESYDADLVELVLSKQSNLIKFEGLAPSVALGKAAASVMERFGKAPEPVVETKGLGAQQLADRKQAQVKKNIDTANKQPSSMKDSGLDSDKAGAGESLDVTKMTQEEFAALPKSTLAKLRGDYLS
jgi:hypothetical protein